jgi:hypothetical protein
MSKKTNKSGKRNSTGVINVGVEVDEGRVMTRGKKARLSQAAAKQEEEALPLGEAVMVFGRSGHFPWDEVVGPSATTTNTITAIEEILLNDTYDPSKWLAERYAARYSLPGSTAGPSNPKAQSSLPGPSNSNARSSLAGPSTRPSDVELEKEVMEGIYSNMLDNSMNDSSMNDTTMEDTSMTNSAIKGKGKSTSKAKPKGKGREVPPAGEVRSGRWRKK